MTVRLFALLTATFTIATGVVNNFEVIDLTDILNADYMPGSLLMLENPKQSNTLFTNESYLEHGGTFDGAFSTMGFHRKMMNEYLCRNYLSEQIITEMKSTRMRRRIGSPAEDPKIPKPPIISLALKNNLIDDEGSSNYQQWLKKSATLQDIYRHYEAAEDKDSPAGVHETAEANEDYDPNIAGVLYQQHHQQSNSPSKLGHSAVGAGYSYNSYPSNTHAIGGAGIGGGLYGTTSSGHTGYGIGGPSFSSHGEYGDGHSGHHSHQEYGGHDHIPKHYGGYEGKDKLADLFDIALTALAYLSFGMFIIQVIMCITMTGTASTMMTMMPMSMSPTGVDPTDPGATGTGDGGGDDTADPDGGRSPDRDRVHYRRHRSIPTISEPNNEALNELARRVLISIEAALVANQDDGACLQKTLCENNVYSRELTTNQKYWIPVWSLGMSWLSGRLVTNVPRLTVMLDSLKASLLGLGKGDCEFIYRNCDLRKQRQLRRKRRR